MKLPPNYHLFPFSLLYDNVNQPCYVDGYKRNGKQWNRGTGEQGKQGEQGQKGRKRNMVTRRTGEQGNRHNKGNSRTRGIRGT